jgi:hypothetical protein
MLRYFMSLLRDPQLAPHFVEAKRCDGRGLTCNLAGRAGAVIAATLRRHIDRQRAEAGGWSQRILLLLERGAGGFRVRPGDGSWSHIDFSQIFQNFLEIQISSSAGGVGASRRLTALPSRGLRAKAILRRERTAQGPQEYDFPERRVHSA